MSEGPDELRARLAAARAARARLASRPLRATIDALAAAAARWRADDALAAGLAASSRLSAPLVAEAVAIAAAALDVAAMTEMVEREWGRGAAERPAPAGAALVAHVLASNVPALALPAVALGCLAGAAVLLKSGRDDSLSAAAFSSALASVDPELGATVVAAYWPGGDPAREAAALGSADVVVLSGGDEALAALAAHVRGRLVAHGPRASVAVVGRGLVDADAAAAGVAFDVALHDQRGCLSPHAVYVETGGAVTPALFAERLHTALERIAVRLPPWPATLQERAAARVHAAEAEWTGAAQVLSGAGGTVIHDSARAFRPTRGGRTVRVHPLAAGAELAALLPVRGIECVGTAGLDPNGLAAALGARGVSRLCPLGRMQRPRLSWPRGQYPPLGVLCGRSGPAAVEVET